MRGVVVGNRGCASATTIEVFKDHKRVASHVREYGRRRYVTDPSHMPASHRAHAEWTPSRLVSWANGVGPAAATLVEKLLESRPHPEHAYRACLGLMSLGRSYGNERLLAACERALATGATSYSSVKSILKENLDRLPVAGAVLTSPVTEHENLRGASPGAFPPWRTAYRNSSTNRELSQSSASRTGSASWSTRR
jgi:transposase